MNKSFTVQLSAYALVTPGFAIRHYISQFSLYTIDLYLSRPPPPLLLCFSLQDIMCPGATIALPPTREWSPLNISDSLSLVTNWLLVRLDHKMNRRITIFHSASGWITFVSKINQLAQHNKLVQNHILYPTSRKISCPQKPFQQVYRLKFL